LILLYHVQLDLKGVEDK